MLGHISRRAFLWITGGSAAGLAFKPARQFIEKLIPYVNPPKYPKPGDWAYFATTCRECPAGCGMLMWHRDGRVTKAEGNPLHPLNKAKLCIRGQSSVQGEYDPDRIKKVLFRQEDGNHKESTWEVAMESIRSSLNQNRQASLVSDLQTGSLAEVMQTFTDKYSQKAVLFYEAFNYESIRKANQQLYGRDVIPRYNIKDCDLIVSFNSDFLETWLAPVEYSREFGKFHTLKKKSIGKYIYLGSTETMSAANADRFIRIEPGTEAEIIYRIAEKLREKGAIKDAQSENLVPPVSKSGVVDEKTIEEITRHIIKAKNSMVLAGSPVDTSQQGVETAKAAALLNELLGNKGRIDFGQYHALSNAAYKQQVNDFFSSLSGDDVLVIHNTNPVYSKPGVAEQIKQAGKVIYIGTSMNETAQLADWILPANYSLEEWGDYEPWKGTLSLIQPTMATIYDTRSAGDILLDLANKSSAVPFKDYVRSYWRDWAIRNNASLQPVKKENGENKTEKFYKKALQSVCIQGKSQSEHPALEASTDEFEVTTQKLQNNRLHLMVSPSLFLYDGKLANRPWLQEIPHPISNIVWQSWVDMNPQKAENLDVKDGELIKLSGESGTIEAPVRLSERTDPNTIAIEAGQGHWAMGTTATGTGVNAFALLPDHGSPATVTMEKTGRMAPPLYLHPTKDQHERELLRVVDLEALINDTAKKEKIHWPLPKGYDKEHDLYEPHKHQDHRWAMVIDLQKCIGCKACEAACYAENNIITVGRKNLKEGREMSWLKVVPYHIDDERTGFIPIPCQHCDSAPCEPVCPVFASTHTEEGLNAQIYNRCIGTRYCSNNCPYKVRRFNWIRFEHKFPANLQLNPEVTVRDHGVMEKCTFCVQRIKSVQHKAKKENRDVRDQEIQPACAQTCPTDAIVFGDLKDKNSRVSQLVQDTRRYQLLAELNTKPAVIYLKKIRQKA